MSNAMPPTPVSHSPVFVAGHRGMVGAAIVRGLEKAGCKNILVHDRSALDLTDQPSVRRFFEEERPETVYLAAARVGGIHANNSRPAEFIYQNLMIEANVIHSAWQTGVDRLLFLGSSCIYPRLAPQPMAESALLTSPLEPTNEPYALAKIAGIKLCESYNRQYGTRYRSVMPTNLYGPGDNFDLQASHVIPALIRKFHQAKTEAMPEVVVWGSGTPRREFLHVDDMADACLFVMDLDDAVYEAATDPMQSHLNVGTGVDITIAELAKTIGKVVGYTGKVVYDTNKPDGPPRKLLNVDKLRQLGWEAKIGLEEGLAQAFDWFLAHQDDFRGMKGIEKSL